MSRYAAVHENPNGPGDARPTAMQIIGDEGLENALTDKVIFLVGASAGIGVKTARALAATGARLFLGARNTKRRSRLVQNSSTQGTSILYRLIRVHSQACAELRRNWYPRLTNCMC